MGNFKGLEELRELLNETEERYAYIDGHIGESEAQRSELAREITQHEKESKTSSYSLDVFQKTNDTKNKLRDLAQLIDNARKERTALVAANSSSVVSRLSDIKSRWDQESADRFSAKHLSRLEELINEVVKINSDWDKEFNQEQLLIYEDRNKFKPYISPEKSAVLGRYPGGLSMIKMHMFNDLAAKVIG
ncbi:hypothetical protein P7H60_07630 [Vagococcus carniphilus]|uniref:hypothetical protein n=1 Tax=Vagococcus carniphilus TaxID=218144 RepID=UPI00288FB250|nr:hypothetical protein [Vagococcus carniphilus]MDT2849032.1 hypothetical protein [Vagococcus carniphilus]